MILHFRLSVCSSGKISHMDHARWQSFPETVFEAY